MGKIQKVYDALGGRKSIFLLLLVIVSLFSTFIISVEYYTQMMQYLAVMYGGFCVGNGIEHYTSKDK